MGLPRSPAQTESWPWCADHAERGRRSRNHRRCAGALSIGARAQAAGHLLTPQNRQDAVKVPFSPQVDRGGGGQPHQLQQQTACANWQRAGTTAYMVDSADELRTEWFDGAVRVG